MNMNSAPRPNRKESVGNVEAFDKEKLAGDFADLAEKNQFAQIEILAKQIKDTLDREDIMEALERAIQIYDDRHPIWTKTGKLGENDIYNEKTAEWTAKFSEIKESFRDGGRNATE